MNKRIFWAALGLLGFAAAGSAFADPRTSHKEDPFPFACASFAGEWQSKDGEHLSIRQNGCAGIVIVREYQGMRYRIEAPLNGEPTHVHSNNLDLVERYEWKGLVRPDRILAQRSYSYPGRTVVENTDIHQLSDTLIYESIEITTKFANGKLTKRTGTRYLERM